MLLYERTSNVEHDSGLIFENRPKNGHFRPFFVWQFWPILRLGFEHSFFYPSKCVPIVCTWRFFQMCPHSLHLAILNFKNFEILNSDLAKILKFWIRTTWSHFLIWKFVKSTYKVYSSGKKKNDFYKKASPCNTASTGKSTTATAKAFEPLKLNDQYVRPPAQAQLKFRTFWWSHKFHNYANSYIAFNVAH